MSEHKARLNIYLTVLSVLYQHFIYIYAEHNITVLHLTVFTVQFNYLAEHLLRITAKLLTYDITQTKFLLFSS